MEEEDARRRSLSTLQKAVIDRPRTSNPVELMPLPPPTRPETALIKSNNYISVFPKKTTTQKMNKKTAPLADRMILFRGTLLFKVARR